VNYAIKQHARANISLTRIAKRTQADEIARESELERFHSKWKCSRAASGCAVSVKLL
jgi:hypothetical protein